MDENKKGIRGHCLKLGKKLGASGTSLDRLNLLDQQTVGALI